MIAPVNRSKLCTIVFCYVLLSVYNSKGKYLILPELFAKKFSFKVFGDSDGGQRALEALHNFWWQGRLMKIQ